ncbi:ATP synthase F0 subunit B [candidate division WWE3 bacterium CG_4_9_14_3_um_filter_41_6]|uniref:ATP synthase subunit b n=1 Tax=candidate division WWE3 bacterium CG_4_10_14_0_2_um_filter_41_14 TaxID=1975072 RepID=A0A2M7TJG6_UNCKA|nr:MAG: ATP synthase F0 subunit B [candidate division WWE3 bacterium CG_4_10_14_0_2_um_filter_41_14]PJA38725.1 MAG: ATP synthase F0 subunit B [candidate division WWE3 bacterium CG_4_9_14_3_um_filter_41_6]
MEKLGIDVQLIVLQAINFAILLYVLNRFLYKPVLKQLAQRKEQVEQNARVQNDLNERMTQLEKDKEAMLAETKDEAQKILGQAREMGKQLSATLKDDAQKKADELLKKASNDIEIERGRIKDSIKDEVSQIAISAAEHVLRESITSEQKNSITKTAVDKFINHE